MAVCTCKAIRGRCRAEDSGEALGNCPRREKETGAIFPLPTPERIKRHKKERGKQLPYRSGD